MDDLYYAMQDYHRLTEANDALQAQVEQRDAEIAALRADRDAGARDYCALMERYDAQQAEIARLREAGVGYSQQTVDALTKERDALRVKNAALRVAMSDAIVIGGRGDAADAVRLLRKALRGEGT